MNADAEVNKLINKYLEHRNARRDVIREHRQELRSVQGCIDDAAGDIREINRVLYRLGYRGN